MKPVRVRFFGPLLDVTGLGEETMQFSFPVQLSAVEAEILRVHPGLAGREYRIAVDESIREHREVLDDAREIALLPPFSGG